MGYYDLARDARERVKGSIGKEREMWQHRLSDLGIRVGNALMEIGDLVGAARHFETLRSKQSDSDKPHLGKLAMLYLRLGDVTAARKCIEIRENTLAARLRDRILRPLLTMAEGRYEDAISEWRELQTHLKDELVTQNLAVCLLYAGRLEEVCETHHNKPLGSSTVLYSTFPLTVSQIFLLAARIADSPFHLLDNPAPHLSHRCRPVVPCVDVQPRDRL